MKVKKSPYEIFIEMFWRISDFYGNPLLTRYGQPLALRNPAQGKFIAYSQGAKMSSDVREALTDLGVYAKARFDFDLTISNETLSQGHAERELADFDSYCKTYAGDA